MPATFPFSGTVIREPQSSLTSDTQYPVKSTVAMVFADKGVWPKARLSRTTTKPRMAAKNRARWRANRLAIITSVVRQRFSAGIREALFQARHALPRQVLVAA